MKTKIGLTILIILCVLGSLCPINAVNPIKNDNSINSDQYDTILLVHEKSNQGFGVSDVIVGQTAHMTVELLYNRSHPEPLFLKDQIITLSIMKVDENGWTKVLNYAFPTSVTTSKDGLASFDIYTSQLEPGIYKIIARYGGNQLFKPTENIGGIWANPIPI